MLNGSGYMYVGLALFVFLSILPTVPVAVYFMRYVLGRELEVKKRAKKKLLVFTCLAMVIYIGVSIDAFWVEPHWPVVKEISLKGNVGKPLRILHLSDVHLETDRSSREAWLLEQVMLLKPDVIFITGDLHQYNMQDPKRIEEVFGKLEAPLGVYTCLGLDNAALLQEGAPAMKVLIQTMQEFKHGESRIGVVGASSMNQSLYDALSEMDYSIVLNHKPELADEAVGQGVDLYLCGHTHGGQVRIPFWGAIITRSATGKRYESGLTLVGNTAIHTSRGLGMEVRPSPQVRFFCRPEITLIEVSPKVD